LAGDDAHIPPLTHHLNKSQYQPALYKRAAQISALFLSS
jgi:hypothetical protein